MRVHYPRTPHLPWSPGATSDDVRAGDLRGFADHEVVVTEKLDGENTTLYADGLHARSLDSAHHPSRAWVKTLQGRVGLSIPDGWRICGENVHARHSLDYQNLASWFYGFSVWAGELCLDWDESVRFLRGLGIPTPPVLWRGVFDERALRRLRLDTARQEGYVVRTVAGFTLPEFAGRVAKWVRPAHVRTDTHWMHTAVVENGLGPASALWAVRSGTTATPQALLTAVGVSTKEANAIRGTAPFDRTADGHPADPDLPQAALSEVAGRLAVAGRTGDARLAGVLATLLYGAPRCWLAARLARTLGMPLARRVADLARRCADLHRPYPDEERRSGLVRMSAAADLGVLHAVAAAVLTGRDDTEAALAQEQVDWSASHAEDAGLLGEAPLEPLRSALCDAFADLGGDAADRCWAQAREAFAMGRLDSAEEAVAATWRWRSGHFPRLIHLIGPSGSGKSTFVDSLPGVDMCVSLDDLRQERGSRADQGANRAVLAEALDRLDTALARGGTTVWDATSLNPQQRSLVHTVAHRRDALVTHAVVLVEEAELARRNARRAHPVPADVLTAQLRRFHPPYPGQAHRTWYVGAGGTIDDIAGSVRGEDAGPEPAGARSVNAVSNMVQEGQS